MTNSYADTPKTADGDRRVPVAALDCRDCRRLGDGERLAYQPLEPGDDHLPPLRGRQLGRL